MHHTGRWAAALALILTLTLLSLRLTDKHVHYGGG